MKFKNYLDDIDINDIVEEMMTMAEKDNKKLKKKDVKSYAKRYNVNEKRLQNAYEQIKKYY